MKIKIITAVSTIDHPGIHKLDAALEYFGYDYDIIVDSNINWNWGGLSNIYEWCKSSKSDGYTHFLYTDGFDTLPLAGIEDILESYTDPQSFLYSAEKACFPRLDWQGLHPDSGEAHRWKYLNHGQFIAPIALFLSEYSGVFSLPITCQEWAMEKYLSGNPKYKLDLECAVFQSIAFKCDDEFSILDGAMGERRIVNNILGVKPVFFHANGRSEFDWVYKLME